MTKLYPIFYQGKNWYRSDCDDLFVTFYTSRECLSYECAVYVGEDFWITPDGKNV